MSTLQNSQPAWPISTNPHHSKYEKCLNITEEIYKRINITFQIKKNESGSQSDVSNSSLIDSNELSNGTDLFAYDKSSSISSSVSDISAKTSDKFINNNNEESKFKKTVPFLTAQRPKKRFRKRVKKRQITKANSDSDCSSDEGLPLSRIVVDYSKSSEDGEKAPTNEDTEDIKKEEVLDYSKKEQEVSDSLKKLEKQVEDVTPHPVAVDLTSRVPIVQIEPLDFTLKASVNPQATVEDAGNDSKCPICNAVFRGSRGLKRHMTMSHISAEDSSPLK